MAKDKREWRLGEGSTINMLVAICEKAEQDNPGFKIFQIVTNTQILEEKESKLTLPSVLKKVPPPVAQIYYPLLVKEP